MCLAFSLRLWLTIMALSIRKENSYLCVDGPSQYDRSHIFIDHDVKLYVDMSQYGQGLLNIAHKYSTNSKVVHT